MHVAGDWTFLDDAIMVEVVYIYCISAVDAACV